MQNAPRRIRGAGIAGTTTEGMIMNASTTLHEAPAMRRALLLFAETVMRPVIRMMLRYGLSYPEFNQIGRRLYVDIAISEPEFRIPRRKRQYKSRVACITGLSRKEVLRLVDAPRSMNDPELQPGNRAARVLHGWISETRYLDPNGAPMTLPFRAPAGKRSFSELVQKYSGDIPPRAIFDELKRAGACASNDVDEIRVVVASYVAQPVDVDALTSAAFRIASSLAIADAGLAVPAASARTRLRVHSSAG